MPRVLSSLAVLLVQEIASSEHVTKLLVEISRHGARSTVNTIYPFTVDPAENFKKSGQLTELGAQQHYRMGQYVRSKYSSFLFDTNSLEEQIYV